MRYRSADSNTARSLSLVQSKVLPKYENRLYANLHDFKYID